MAHRLSDRLSTDADGSLAGLGSMLDTLGDVAALADAARPTHQGLRVDLHCHSDASNKTGEAALNMIGCPESYSRPRDVYAQALRRGMDFVTITDHDSVGGVDTIRDMPGVLIGEELTCWFPEDGCKMHILVYGHTRQQHADLQKLARNLYDVADYFEANRLAHSVAHPIYRQNDKLERWHLERLLLLFKSFECLNGAHSSLHRDAFEPLLDKLDEAEIKRLSQVHGLRPRFAEPWNKGRTAGSDDHGLLNIGRTWTELPDDVQTADDVVEAIRQGRTRPGGESGSSAKLAHTFWGVAVRYYTRSMLEKNGNVPNLSATLMQAMVGERSKPGKLQLAYLAARGKVRKLGTSFRGRFSHGTDAGTIKTSGLIKDLFVDSVRRRLPEHPDLVAELEKGLPPLGNHDGMMRFVHAVNRDVSGGIADAFQLSVDRASFTGIFDAIGAALAQQFVLSPHYFALFHQNKERRLLPSITRQDVLRRGDRLKVALFTDTFDDVNGVARFIRDMGRLAQGSGKNLTVLTSVPAEDVRYDRDEAPYRQNFEPLVSRPMPLYDELKANIPPILEVLDLCDREQFDVIHVSTPGPMGLLGLLAAAMLRVPVLATYHTDFPAYVEKLTGDHRQAGNVAHYMRWFYKVPEDRLQPKLGLQVQTDRSGRRRGPHQDHQARHRSLEIHPRRPRHDRPHPARHRSGQDAPRAALRRPGECREEPAALGRGVFSALRQAERRRTRRRRRRAVSAENEGSPRRLAGLLPGILRRPDAAVALRVERPVRLPVANRHPGPGRHGGPGVRIAVPGLARRRAQGDDRRQGDGPGASRPRRLTRRRLGRCRHSSARRPSRAGPHEIRQPRPRGPVQHSSELRRLLATTRRHRRPTPPRRPPRPGTHAKRRGLKRRVDDANAGYDTEANHRRCREDHRLASLNPATARPPAEGPEQAAGPPVASADEGTLVDADGETAQRLHAALAGRGVLAMMKRLLGDRLSARSDEAREREMWLMVLVHNISLLRRRRRAFLRGTRDSFSVPQGGGFNARCIECGMSHAFDLGGLSVDSDWKAQAREEKKRLAEEAAARQEAAKPKETPATSPTAGSTPAAARATEAGAVDFKSLVKSIGDQTLIYLGIVPVGEGGRGILDLDAAKKQIDLLGVLESKTTGNLDAAEQSALDLALYESRSRFSSVASRYIL